MRRYLVLSGLALSFLLLSACSSNSTSGSLTCEATASVSSGDPTQVGTTLELTDVTVDVLNGSSGPFTITLPGASAATSTSTVYTDPTALAVTTSAADVVSSSVSVTDTSDNDTTTCAITLNGTGTSTGAVSITASPSSSVAVGSSVTLTAANVISGATSPTFTFTQSPQVSGVTLTQLSSLSGTATVTSLVAAAVTILVTETYNGVTETGEITLDFGTGVTTSGNISITMSPSSSVAAGTPITLTATDANASAIFAFAPSTQGVVTISVISANTAEITSSIATTIEIYVTDLTSGASTSVLLSFEGSSQDYSESLTCQINRAGGYYMVGEPVVSTISTSTGEAVLVTSWNAGEPWSVAPTFPLSPPLTVTYQYSGWKYISIQAQGAVTGLPCNGGAALTDQLYVNN